MTPRGSLESPKQNADGTTVFEDNSAARLAIPRLDVPACSGLMSLGKRTTCDEYAGEHVI